MNLQVSPHQNAYNRALNRQAYERIPSQVSRRSRRSRSRRVQPTANSQNVPNGSKRSRKQAFAAERRIETIIQQRIERQEAALKKKEAELKKEYAKLKEAREERYREMVASQRQGSRKSNNYELEQ